MANNSNIYDISNFGLQAILEKENLMETISLFGKELEFCSQA